MRNEQIVLSKIPPSSYCDPKIFQRENEQVFRRHWGFACLTTELKRSGAYITSNVGGDNVIVVRDKKKLRAFHNVCPHRGSEIASGAGITKEFQCPYHAWTYGLDGQLIRVPGVNTLQEQISLQPLRTEIWGPFVFVCSNPDIEPLSHFYGDLFDYFQNKVDLTEIASFGTMDEITFEIEANWKVVVENSLECYHCAYAHPGLASSIDLRQFEQWTRGWWSAQQAPQKVDGNKRGAALGQATYENARVSGLDSARFNFLFPNLYISIWPGSLGFSTTEITPKGHHRTETRHRRFFHNEVSETEQKESHAFIREVINEDIALCESVQRGLDQGVTDQRLMVKRSGSGPDETCILHFHELLLNKVGKSTSTSIKDITL
jgi:phenylpropionate dioxygenase-like ring-hydroxylating dioxygenase large terminal subunit